ncbi:hypothetical protein DFJ73DRAFT_193024 [Zopfochytrium polystomum]|nr:hypothetical protein DFJ73DRAFT_193024 [Zopfochytrium polystomum]
MLRQTTVGELDKQRPLRFPPNQHAIRKILATFGRNEGRFLSLFLQEARDVVSVLRSVVKEQNLSMEYFAKWGEKEDEDIKHIAEKIAALNQVLAEAEAEMIVSYKVFFIKFQEIKTREDRLAKKKTKLRQAEDALNKAQRLNKPTEFLNTEYNMALEDYEESAAVHAGFLRADFQEALKFYFEGYKDLAEKMTTVAQFGLHLADRIPQGRIKPGDERPKYEDKLNADRVFNDFKKAVKPKPITIPDSPSPYPPTPRYESPTSQPIHHFADVVVRAASPVLHRESRSPTPHGGRSRSPTPTPAPRPASPFAPTSRPPSRPPSPSKPKEYLSPAPFGIRNWADRSSEPSQKRESGVSFANIPPAQGRSDARMSSGTQSSLTAMSPSSTGYPVSFDAGHRRSAGDITTPVQQSSKPRQRPLSFQDVPKISVAPAQLSPAHMPFPSDGPYPRPQAYSSTYSPTPTPTPEALSPDYSGSSFAESVFSNFGWHDDRFSGTPMTVTPTDSVDNGATSNGWRRLQDSTPPVSPTPSRPHVDSSTRRSSLKWKS